MEKDHTREMLLQCAVDEIETVQRSLARYLENRKRPTMAQMSAMKASIDNAKIFVNQSRS